MSRTGSQLEGRRARLHRSGARPGHAHQSGLVHRDFKPGNVLRNQNGRCQVADFGIAISSGRSVRGEDAESTRPDVEDDAEYRLAGTPAYMAPELLLGAAADERSDQFSFSVALYEALVGGRPFKTTSLELLDDNRHEPPRGSVPPRVVRVLERGFATSPSERFESMTALLDDLERAVKPRRTGRFVLGSSVVVGAATWAALALPDDACDVALAPLATWSAEGQAALEAVFARDREAARQWPAMARTVDSFVTDWVETSTKLCEDRSLGPFAFESQQCLAELRSDADATLASLQLASDAATRTALHRAEAWTNPAMCLRPSFVEASKSASMFRRPRHRVVQLRLRDIVNAIDSGGEIDPLAKQVDALRPEVAALDDHALLARLALVDVAVAIRTDMTALEPALKRAYHEARAADDNMLASIAANGLTRLFALELGDVKAALEWGEIARAESRRDGVPIEATVKTELVVAIAYDVAGRWDEAADGYARALAAAEELEGEKRERARADILTSVSGFEVARGNADHGLSAAEEAVEILERLDGGPSRSSLAAMGNVGFALVGLGRLDEAERLFERELDLHIELQGPDHPERLAALINLGMVADRQHDMEEARRYWLEADAIVLRHHGERLPDRADIALNLGWQDMTAGNYEAAVERFVWAKDVFEETVGATAEQTFLAHVALSTGRLALGSRRQACEHLPGLIQTARETVGESRVVARLLHVQGDCELSAGEVASAESALLASLAISERVSDARPEQLDVEIALADVLARQGSDDEALRLAEEVASDVSSSPATRARAEAMLIASARPREPLRRP